MKTQIFIPERINVGFQKREDTYTKRLAYVIYYDNKGVLRKETSWQGWRDKKIPNEEFTNEPMEGFVLNKGVGGQRHSYGWNARNEYIRVYDPRNFEFEISVANLLWILQECTSTKGKGLEGKFVYGWEGKELILIPVETKEYDDCVSYTKLQDGKIGVKDLKPGFIYRNKTMEDWIYLGRLDFYAHPSKPYDYSTGYYSRNEYYKEKYKKEMARYEKQLKGSKQHVFVRADKKEYYSKYDFPSSLSAYKECVSIVAVDNYAELLQDYQDNCKHAAPYNKAKFTSVTKKDLKELTENPWSNQNHFLDGVKQRCKMKPDDDKVILYMSHKDYNNYGYRGNNDKWNEISVDDFMTRFTNKIKTYDNKYTEKTYDEAD